MVKNFLCLFVLLFTESALFAVDEFIEAEQKEVCKFLLILSKKQRYHEGEKLKNERKAQLVPYAKDIFLLGSGEEARVYRVVLNSDKSYLLRERIFRPDEEITLRQYIENMEFLKKLESKGEGFRVAQILSVNNQKKSIRISDVKGFDLEKIVKTLGSESPLSKKLMSLYRKNLDLLLESAKKTHPEHRIDTSGFIETEVENMSWFLNTDIAFPNPSENDMPFLGPILAPRNVIVDLDDFKMTIIDSQ